jgi:hypothetical protein
MSVGREYAGAIAKMQTGRAAVSTMNSAHRKVLPLVLLAFSRGCGEIA